MPKITDIRAREILDSRGNPTVAVRVTLAGGVFGVASVPSGASTGTHEALELRDGDPKRYGGKGMRQAVANVDGPLRDVLLGKDAADQRGLDQAMMALDGTANKSRLGANAILGASLAAARAAAADSGRPLYAWLRGLAGLPAKGMRLPVPMMNLLNGGRHADFAIDVQECMVLPRMKTFAERVRAGSEIFHALGGLIKEMDLPVTVGDEGGYAPRLGANEQAFSLLVDAAHRAGYRAGRDVMLGADVAASELYDTGSGRYRFRVDGAELATAELISLYAGWKKKYPIAVLEDGLAEDDWDGWTAMTADLGGKMTLIGDDLFVTDVKRLQMGISRQAANAVLIKVNQIGTLTETLDCVALARKNAFKVAVSHRSGETADTFIADLSAAVDADFIKTGSLSRSERVEKYNRLMEIEEETA